MPSDPANPVNPTGPTGPGNPGSPGNSSSPGNSGGPRHPRGGRRITVVLIVAVAACAAAAALWVSLTPSEPPGHRLRIAVLPFDNAAGGEAGASLADGFAAELISGLSTFGELRVIARSSSFRFRGPETRDAEIARALGAGSIVRGSVSRDGDTIDVRAALTVAGSPEVLWEGGHRRALADFFDVRADIAERIAEALNAPATAAETVRLRSGGTFDPGALRYYLLGRDVQNRGTTASALTGAGHFASAIALDPSFARAYAGIAECHAFVGEQGGDPAVRDTAAARAKEAAQAAIAIDPSLAGAHAALASVRFRLDWNFGEAEEGFRRAITLGPGSARAREEFGTLLALLGRGDESLAELRTAAELDPLSTEVKTAIGRALYYTKEYGASIEQFRLALKADPADADAHIGMGMSCVAAGRYHEAVEAINEAVRLTGGGDAALAALGYAYAKRGDRASAIEILDRFRSPQGGTGPSPFFAALILRGLDQAADAMAFLEQAAVARDVRLTGIGVDPAWDGSRDDARFAALLEKIGLSR